MSLYCHAFARLWGLGLAGTVWGWLRLGSLGLAGTGRGSGGLGRVWDGEKNGHSGPPRNKLRCWL